MDGYTCRHLESQSAMNAQALTKIFVVTVESDFFRHMNVYSVPVSMWLVPNAAIESNRILLGI
jgi:hypothetical protein